MLYAAWPAALGGQPLSPNPRRSVATTVKRSASRGATRCHIRCVSGTPWSSRTGGPSPPRRPWIVVPAVGMSNAWNPSNTGPSDLVPLAHRVGEVDAEPRQLRHLDVAV